MGGSERLRQLEIFRRVAEQGSISAAARSLAIGQPAVSKHLAALEHRLRVRLMERSTQRTTLTLEGRVFYDRLRPLLDGLDLLEDDVTASARGIEGLLTLQVPVGIGQMHLTRELIRFQKLHPRIELEVRYEDRFADLVVERVDVALRIGALSSPDLVVKRLAGMERWLLASPRYLRQHGTPRTPEELQAHNFVRYSQLQQGHRLVLERPGERVEIRMKSRLLVNNSMAIRELLLAHYGVGLAPIWLTSDAIERRDLVRVLPEWGTPPTPLHAVYPSATLKTQRVATVIDFLGKALHRIPGFGETSKLQTSQR
jgi:DNA-binding transcriptional LysR family regulator